MKKLFAFLKEIPALFFCLFIGIGSVLYGVLGLLHGSLLVAFAGIATGAMICGMIYKGYADWARDKRIEKEGFSEKEKREILTDMFRTLSKLHQEK